MADSFFPVNRTVSGGVLLKETHVKVCVDTSAERVVTVQDLCESEFEDGLAGFSRLAFRVALGVLHNASDAEDVAQEALIRAHRSVHRLRAPERFRVWLVRTTWRLAMDKVRATLRRARYEQESRPSRTNAPSVEEAVASREIQHHVERAIDALPQKLRMTLILAAIEGYDTAETAQLLGVPEGTVKSRLHLARKQLAERLQWLVIDTKPG
jgi:RNA polymerase sigma-70 factor, ECF subfamily